MLRCEEKADEWQEVCYSLGQPVQKEAENPLSCVTNVSLCEFDYVDYACQILVLYVNVEFMLCLSGSDNGYECGIILL